MTDDLSQTIAADGALFAERYQVVSAIGEGGMGTVYRARDRELDEEIALKILSPELAQRPDALVRFRREVKLARRVTHPNVARTYDLGTWSGVHYLTMELVAGESLRSRLRAERASLPEVLRTASEIAKGLCAAHAVGVVHRDLKPDNVLLGGERVVLTDFGIAVLSEGLDPGSLRTGAIVGTPAYMAPEQLDGRGVDGRADVYALGVVLYELLTGALPFAAERGFSLARMSSRPVDPRELAPGLPDGVAELVLALLEPRREQRMDAASTLERLDALRGAALARPDAPRTPSFSLDSVPTPPRTRTIVVSPFDAVPELEREGRDLGQAISDALSELRGLSPLPLASSASADLRVEGSLRTSGERIRVRLRLVDGRGVAWTDVVDHEQSDWFALEDDVAARVRDAVRVRSTTSDAGPADPEQREAFERALAAYQSFSLPNVKTAIAELEALHARAGDDPHVASLLGAALLQAWTQTGAVDAALLARAEDLSLRALDADPSISRTYMTLALVRLHSGELRAGLRTVREALARSPRLADGHIYLGQLLCESLHTADGLRRLELAMRLEPRSMLARGLVARSLALLGDRPGAERVLAEGIARAGPTALIVMECRIAVWWGDGAYANDIATRIEQAKAGAAWDMAAPMLRSIARGELSTETKQGILGLTGLRAAPRMRAMMHEVAAEYLGWAGEHAEALEHVEALAELPVVNVEWLDHCPNLAAVRADSRFARARAIVAARAAELWQ